MENPEELVLVLYCIILAPVFKCHWCLVCYASQKNLVKHKKYCRQKIDGASEDDGDDEVEAMTHQCGLCLKKFSQKFTLVRHLWTHTGQRPFQCECGASFLRNDALRSHQETHNRPHIYCHLCPAEPFSSSSKLQRHLQTHAEESIFRCEVCGHECNQAEHLRQHMRVHTGEAPYSCDICGQQFKQRAHRQKHMRTHSKERPYKCLLCGYASARRDTLRKHIRNKHPGESEEINMVDFLN